MGFLNGRITYVRYRVGGEAPLPFAEEHLERVQQHALGRHGDADPTDGLRVGWSGGDHVLDLSFDPGKNLNVMHLSSNFADPSHVFRRAFVIEAVGEREILRVIRYGHVCVAALTRSADHLLNRAATIRFDGVHVHVTANVAQLYQTR